MPKLEEVFSKLLKKKFGQGTFKRPTLNDFLDSKYHNEIHNIYKKLNGKLNNYPVAFRGFDIELKNCIVELDEAQHFNRYRSITLESSVYKINNSFSTTDYKIYCNQFENECLKKGNNRKYWKTSSSDEQFGKSATDGILFGDGSSRWRQRAFYDFLRDVGQYIGSYKLIRISIYQMIEDKTIGEILERELIKYYPLLLDKLE
jgi:hypothetical protein